MDPTRTALGTWSGGRFMHFGEQLDDERLLALYRPDERIRTVLTPDVYGQGEAHSLLGRALGGRAPRGQADHPRGRLRRPVPRRRRAGSRVPALRPSLVPPRRLGRGRAREARPPAPRRRAPRTEPAPAGGVVEPGAWAGAHGGP